LQFRSFVQPLVVFSAIPLAVVGSLGALLLTGYSFSFMAFVGLAALMGIVVNNSIILVDFANGRRAEGVALVDAIEEAAVVRFVPILLTTMTTIGGLLPLTLTGSDLWSPLGWALIGGLASSTVLTLVVVPSLMRVFTRAS
ncbi:MAG TPA: efflux RND transporter permease subunit, partial [Thermoanaerobaculia bacterium]|nr:efflux RND transporter permease subunit [Thermoanaerobaculia bacterium]